jgi:fumarylpyruvate hydrolase
MTTKTVTSKTTTTDTNTNTNTNTTTTTAAAADGFAFDPPPIPSVAIIHHHHDGATSSNSTNSTRFPVHRIYCVGRNYANHVTEMGGDPKLHPPMFFCKPPDAVIESGSSISLSKTNNYYYSSTNCNNNNNNNTNLHYEVELVVAIGPPTTTTTTTPSSKEEEQQKQQGFGIFGYAVGLDLTRCDLQAAAKKTGGPWDTAKAFDRLAPIGPITPIITTSSSSSSSSIWNNTNTDDDSRIYNIELTVNGVVQQSAPLTTMIWSVPEILRHLSDYFELRPGDLIFTGTPSGVGPLRVGDEVRGTVEGLEPVELKIVE